MISKDEFWVIIGGGGGDKRYNEWILEATVNGNMTVNMHLKSKKNELPGTILSP